MHEKSGLVKCFRQKISQKPQFFQKNGKIFWENARSGKKIAEKFKKTLDFPRNIVYYTSCRPNDTTTAHADVAQ